MQILIAVTVGENIADPKEPRGRTLWVSAVNQNSNREQRIIDAMQAMPNLLFLAEQDLIEHTPPSTEPQSAAVQPKEDDDDGDSQDFAA